MADLAVKVCAIEATPRAASMVIVIIGLEWQRT